MKLSKMKREDLELYSYIDLSKMILEEEGKPLNTPTIFKKICTLLGMSDEEYADKIGDYYTSLTTDKDFVLLDGNWDLRDHHPVTVILDDDDLEEDIEDEEDMADEMIEVEDDDTDINADEVLDDLEDDDDLGDDDEDLTIIPEEELED